MAELTSIKLKEMDSLTKTMNENYKAARHQTSLDLLEIEQIDATLSHLRSRLDPLLVAASRRATERDHLSSSLALTDAALNEMLKTQEDVFHAAKRDNNKLGRNHALEVLQEERNRVPKEGRSAARRSMKADFKRMEDKAAKDAKEVIRGVVPFELMAKLECKVVMTENIPLPVGMTAGAPQQLTNTTVAVPQSVPKLNVGKTAGKGGPPVASSQSAR